MLKAFEGRWTQWNGLPSLGLSSWAGGALAALEFAGVEVRRCFAPPTPSWRRRWRRSTPGRGRVRRLQSRRPLHVLR